MALVRGGLTLRLKPEPALVRGSLGLRLGLKLKLEPVRHTLTTGTGIEIRIGTGPSQDP